MKKVVRIKTDQKRLSKNITARQITAMIVAINELQESMENAQRAGLGHILPPLRLRSYLSTLAKLLGDFQIKSPEADFMLKMSPEQNMAVGYLCMVTCMANCPPGHSSSQVERDIQVEIFGQLVELLPDGPKRALLNTAKKAIQRQENRNQLRLLPNKLITSQP